MGVPCPMPSRFSAFVAALVIGVSVGVPAQTPAGRPAETESRSVRLNGLVDPLVQLFPIEPAGGEVITEQGDGLIPFGIANPDRSRGGSDHQGLA